MKRRILAFAVGAGAVLVAGPATPAHASCPNESVRSITANRAQMDAAVLCLINEARALYAPGSSPIRYDATLSLASQRHTDDEIARGYDGHTAKAPAPYGASPQDRAVSAGWPADWGVDENLFGGYLTPFRLVEGWLNSDPGHCGTLLTREYDRVGFGFTEPKTYAFLFVGPDKNLSNYTRGNNQCPKTTGLKREPVKPEWTIEDETYAKDPSHPVWGGCPPAGSQSEQLAGVAPGSCVPGAAKPQQPGGPQPTGPAQPGQPSLPATTQPGKGADPGLRIVEVRPILATRKAGRGLRLKVLCSAAACSGTVRLLRNGKQVAKAGFSAGKGTPRTVKLTVSRTTEKAMKRARQRKLTFEVSAGGGKLTGSATI